MKGCVPCIINNYLLLSFTYYILYLIINNNYMLIIIFRECLPNVVQTSTLPINEGDILQHATLVFEVYKLHLRLMTLVYQSWEISLSHLNRGETPSPDLPLSQLTLSKIKLTLGPHVIAYNILSLYHSLLNHHE